MKNDDEEAVAAPRKRAPRKRAPVADDEATPRPRTRRAPAKSAEEAPVAKSRPAETEDETPVRRAPTPIGAEKRAARRGTHALLVGVVVLLVGLGTSIGIGYSDRGQIDVVAVVNDRNEKIGRGEIRGENGESMTQTIPVQDTDTRPNGGLVPAAAPTETPSSTEAAPADTASSTSTETASSSEAVSTSSTTPDAI